MRGVQWGGCGIGRQQPREAECSVTNQQMRSPPCRRTQCGVLTKKTKVAIGCDRRPEGTACKRIRRPPTDGGWSNTPTAVGRGGAGSRARRRWQSGEEALAVGRGGAGSRARRRWQSTLDWWH